MMVPFFGGCDTLKGCRGPSQKKRHFSGHLQWLKRVLRIDPFDQESVHRCSLGCSTYLDADFWIRDWLAICWAIKWQFLRCQKVADFFWPPQILEFWAINWHRCVTIWKLKRHFLFYFFGVWCLSYGHLSNSPKYESSIYGTKGR